MAVKWTGQNNRTRFPGPITRTPHTFSFVFAAVLVNDTLIQRITIPAAFRVCETEAVANVVGSDPTYTISDGAAGGTDIVAARNMPASNVSEVLTPTSAPALANRDLVKGDVLTVTIVADAGDTAAQLRVNVSGYFEDFIVADPVND